MKKVFIPLLLICGILLLFHACRRTELQPESQQELPKADNQYDRFFAVPASSPDEAKAIAGAVKKQNEQFRFVSGVIKKAGYPVWDKARIVNNTAGTVSGRNASDSVPDEVVYIPFVLDSGGTTMLSSP